MNDPQSSFVTRERVEIDVMPEDREQRCESCAGAGNVATSTAGMMGHVCGMVCPTCKGTGLRR